MTIPTISTLPVAPARTDAPATFVTRADSFLAAIVVMQGELNTSIGAMNADFITIGNNVTAAQAAQTAAEAAQSAAETAETNAETAETNAETAQTAAEAAQAAAESAQSSTEAVYDAFDDRYLGAKASDPALDNDGNALQTGAQYFNTTSDTTRVYNGSGWQDSAALATSIEVSQISDLDSNLDSFLKQDGTSAEVISFDSNEYFAGIFSDKVVSIGNTGTAQTINCNTGTVYTATLTGNCTFTLATPNSDANRATSFTLVLTNDATASRTVAFAGGTFRYPGGSVSRSTGANVTDIWFLFSPDGGTIWYVTLPAKNLS